VAASRSHPSRHRTSTGRALRLPFLLLLLFFVFRVSGPPRYRWSGRCSPSPSPGRHGPRPGAGPAVHLRLNLVIALGIACRSTSAPHHLRFREEFGRALRLRPPWPRSVARQSHRPVQLTDHRRRLATLAVFPSASSTPWVWPAPSSCSPPVPSPPVLPAILAVFGERIAVQPAARRTSLHLRSPRSRWYAWPCGSCVGDHLGRGAVLVIVVLASPFLHVASPVPMPAPCRPAARPVRPTPWSRPGSRPSPRRQLVSWSTRAR